MLSLSFWDLCCLSPIGGFPEFSQCHGGFVNNTPFRSLSSRLPSPQLLSWALSRQLHTVTVIVFLFVSEVKRAGYGLVHPCLQRTWHCAWCIVSTYVGLICEIAYCLLHLLDWELIEGSHKSTLYPHILASCHTESSVSNCLFKSEWSPFWESRG